MFKVTSDVGMGVVDEVVQCAVEYKLFGGGRQVTKLRYVKGLR